MTGNDGATRPLLRSQKNAILAKIRDVGLNPTDFRWETVISKRIGKQSVEQLLHAQTESYFLFDFYLDGGRYRQWSECSPGLDDVVTVKMGHEKWINRFELVEGWLKGVKVEHDEPDLWGTILQETLLISAGSIESNEDFSADEQKFIRERLDELERYLIDVHHLKDEVHQTFVRDRLNYLAEASSRVGMKDWFLIFVGMLMNIILEFSLSSEVAREVFRFSAQLLGHVLRGFLSSP